MSSRGPHSDLVITNETFGSTSTLMAEESPPSATRADQPHLVSLVLQSKKALQHGEQLCSKANALTNASAQCAVDVLALNAKVKWISHAVIEQLKVRCVNLNTTLIYPFIPSRSWPLAWQRASSTNVPNSTSRFAYVLVLHNTTGTTPHCTYQRTTGMGRRPLGAYLCPRYHP